MKTLQKIGLLLFVVGLTQFTALTLMGEFEMKSQHFEQLAEKHGIRSSVFILKSKEVFIAVVTYN